VTSISLRVFSQRKVNIISTGDVLESGQIKILVMWFLLGSRRFTSSLENLNHEARNGTNEGTTPGVDFFMGQGKA